MTSNTAPPPLTPWQWPLLAFGSCLKFRGWSFMTSKFRVKAKKRSETRAWLGHDQTSSRRSRRSLSSSSSVGPGTKPTTWCSRHLAHLIVMIALPVLTTTWCSTWTTRWSTSRACSTTLPSSWCLSTVVSTPSFTASNTNRYQQPCRRIRIFLLHTLAWTAVIHLFLCRNV